MYDLQDDGLLNMEEHLNEDEYENRPEMKISPEKIDEDAVISS